MNPPTVPSYPASAATVRFSCPLCTAFLEVPRSKTGTTGPCPVCSATIIAPSVVSYSTPNLPEKSVDLPDLQENTVLRSDPNRLESEEFGPSGAAIEIEPRSKPVRNRLCDNPPRPHFAARDALDSVPYEQRLTKRSRKERGRKRESSAFAWVRREAWYFFVIVVSLFLGYLVFHYSDRVFDFLRIQKPEWLHH